MVSNTANMANAIYCISAHVTPYRCKSMFPGDIQKATAVARKPGKQFEYLDQVIVFSAKGKRPMPDMLGGGDLDGDKYFVGKL